MDRRRALFAASLGLFAAWVAALGTLAATSGRRPVEKPRRPPPGRPGAAR